MVRESTKMGQLGVWFSEHRMEREQEAYIDTEVRCTFHTQHGKVGRRAGLNVCGAVCMHWVTQHREYSGRKMEQHFFLKLCVLLQNSYLGNIDNL